MAENTDNKDSEPLEEALGINDPNKMSLEDYVVDVVLPQWLQDVLPEPKKPIVVDYDLVNKKYCVLRPDSSLHSEHENIESAYDTAETLNKRESGLEFSTNLPELNGENSGLAREGMISVPTGDKGYSRMLLASTQSSRLASLKYDYKNWVENILPYYEENPEDFMASYSFVDCHPAFWIRDDRRSTNRPFDWRTSGHAMSLWHLPSRADNGNIVHMMETGGHVPPNYTITYHDLRLDTYAPTYEEAIIELAKLVHKFFENDGEPREDVDYEKSDFELLLDERLAEMQEDLAEDTDHEENDNNND